MNRSRKIRVAIVCVALVSASFVTEAGADDSYVMPDEPDKAAGTACTPFPRDHALHADVSTLPSTGTSALTTALASKGGTTAGGWSLYGANNWDVPSDYWWVVHGMPVNLTNAATPRSMFRLGFPQVQQISPPNWWLGYMWRMSNGAGNLPDRSTIPVPAAAVPMPATSIGQSFPIGSAYVEGDAPHNNGDRHYLTIETDECKSYETWATRRPGAIGNTTSLVNSGGTSSFEADAGVTWDLSTVGAAYRNPDAVFPQFGYGTSKPFGGPWQINGTSSHGTAAANRYRSSDAAGLPLSTMVLRYDDVAVDPLDHPLHLALPTDLISQSTSWPAIYSDGNGAHPAAVPMGTWFRLSITNAEMQSRLPEGHILTAVERNILDGLRTHGMILADGTSANGSWGFPVAPDAGWTADNREVVTKLDFSDFAQLTDPSVMRASSGTIASTYPTWFEIK